MYNRILMAVIFALAVFGCGDPISEHSSDLVVDEDTASGDASISDPTLDLSEEEGSTGDADAGTDTGTDPTDDTFDVTEDIPKDVHDIDEEDFGGCVAEDPDTGNNGDPIEDPDGHGDIADTEETDGHGDADVADLTDVTDTTDATDTVEEPGDADIDRDTSLDVADDTDPDIADLSDADDGSEPDSPVIACGELLTDRRDGQTYTTVLLGSQCWMAENLNAGEMILGTEAQQNNGTIERYCYEDKVSNCYTHGGLYQWNEMMSYSPSDSGNPSTTRGICPTGWHVPSDEEWKDLEVFLGMSREDADLTNIWRGENVGTALKEDGTSGFDATMAGRRSSSSFSLLGAVTYHYTATDAGSYAWRRCLSSSADDVGRWNTFPKTYALSVRCVANR